MIGDSLVFQNDKALKIWIYCLIRAGHEEKEILFNHKKMKIEKGQFMTSFPNLRDTLGYSIGTIHNWINFFEQEKMIESKKTNKFTLIKINNWKDYQDTESRMKTERKQNETNNNYKELERNNIYPEILEYWNKGQVVIHKEVSDECKKYIDKFLKEFEVEDLKKAIRAYAETYHNDECYFKHKWTLEEFVKRGNGARVFVYKTPEDYKIKK